MNIPSILRHWFTLAATAVTLWLGSTLLLSADDASALTEAFGKLIEPLVIIGVLVITAVWRIALAWGAKYFRHAAGEETKNNGAGMTPMLVGLCMAAALMGLCPPSCSSDYPITGSLSYRDPKSGAKAGLSYSPSHKLRGSVAVPIYDPETGKRTGYAQLATVEPSGK